MRNAAGSHEEIRQHGAAEAQPKTDKGEIATKIAESAKRFAKRLAKAG
jgi:hypothetical protein